MSTKRQAYKRSVVLVETLYTGVILRGVITRYGALDGDCFAFLFTTAPGHVHFFLHCLAIVIGGRVSRSEAQ